MLQATRLLLSCLFLLLATISSSHAFVHLAFLRRSSTRLFIDDDIADMIDRELYRQQHLKDFENEWMEKNKGAVLQRLNDDYMISMDEEDLRENFRQMQKVIMMRGFFIFVFIDDAQHLTHHSFPLHSFGSPVAPLVSVPAHFPLM